MEGTVTHSQGIHDKMPIQLGRTKGEVYHTFCVLILKRNPLHIGPEETSYLLRLSPFTQKPQDSKQSRGQDEKCCYP